MSTIDALEKATGDEFIFPQKKGTVRDRMGLLVWLFGLIVLSLGAILFTQPGYMDAYYYHHVALNVAEGRGLVEDYVWNYLPPPDTVSHPSNLYWMPLTSLVVVPFFLLLGESFRAAQVPFVALASALVLFTYWLSYRLTGHRRHALAAAALTLFSGFYFAYWSTPDSFALFALTANATLLLSGAFLSGRFSVAADRVLTRRVPWRGSFGRGQGGHPSEKDPSEIAGDSLSTRKQLLFSALAGAFAALSHLSRADGVLLLAVAVVVIAFGCTQSGENARRGLASRITLPILVCLGAYILVMSPWFLRNWQLIGNVLPLAGTKTLFLREYNDFYAFDKDLSWQSYLSWGLWPIVKSKLDALGSNILVLFGMEYHLVPFAVVGLWHLRRNAAIVTFFVYVAVLYLTMSLLFTFPSGRGSMLHSSAALLPWLSIAAVVGLDRSVVLAARRLRHWNVPLAQRNFTLVLVFFAIAFSAFLLLQEASKRNERYDHYNEIAAWLDERDPAALIMIADPPGFFYSSGKGNIVIPSDDLDTVLLAARRYGATYLVLEKVHSRPLHPYYKGEESDPRLQRVAEIGESQIYRLEAR